MAFYILFFKKKRRKTREQYLVLLVANYFDCFRYMYRNPFHIPTDPSGAPFKRYIAYKHTSTHTGYTGREAYNLIHYFLGAYVTENYHIRSRIQNQKYIIIILDTFDGNFRLNIVAIFTLAHSANGFE